MDPALISQLISLIEWGLTGALAFKENDAFVGQFLTTLNAALTENRPLTDAEWAQIRSFGASQHDALQGA